MKQKDNPVKEAEPALKLLAKMTKDGKPLPDVSFAFPCRKADFPSLDAALQLRQQGADFDVRAVYGQFSNDGEEFAHIARFAGLSAIDAGDVELLDQVGKDIAAYVERTSDPSAEGVRELLELEFRLRLRISGECPQWFKRFDFSQVPKTWFAQVAYLCAKWLMVERRYLAALYTCRVLGIVNAGRGNDRELDVWLKLASAVCCRELRRKDDMRWWSAQAAQAVAENGHIQPYLEFTLGGKDSFLAELETVAPEAAEAVRKKEKRVFLNVIRVRNHLTGGKMTELLSRRQMFIAEHIATGSKYWEVAQMLGVSEGCVRFHLVEIFKTLQIGGRDGLKDLVE